MTAADSLHWLLVILRWVGIILLTILKILGWTILIVLLLILLILLIVCISPIRYKVSGHLKEEIRESGGGAEVSWLWGAVRGGGMYADKALRTWVKILWIKKTLSGGSAGETSQDDEDDGFEPDFDDDFDAKAAEKAAEENARKVRAEAEKEKAEAEKAKVEAEKAKTEKAEAEKAKAEAEKAEKAKVEAEKLKAEAEKAEKLKAEAEKTEEAKVEAEKLEIDAEKAEAEKEKTEKTTEETPTDEDGMISVEINPEEMDHLFGEGEEADEIEPATVETKKLPRDILSVLSDYEDKIDELIEKIEGNLDGTSGKVKELKDKADPYLTILKDKKNQKAVAHILKELVYLVKELIPRRADVDLKYSAGSPELTGKTYGLFFMVPACYKNGWYVEPDFDAEKFYAQGVLSLSGRFYIGSVMVVIFRLLVDPNLWHAVRAALKLKKTLDKAKG